jgi:glycosyltransferase involved in cell wall biosynthesis
MKVSVIMPAYNREAYVGTAIRSLLRQRDDADLDIIVIDDGSTDRTAAVVEAFARKEPAVRLVRQANGGISKARNTGLDNIHPDAELVTFLDSDDVSVEGRFAAELPLFREDPELAMTYSRMTWTDRIDDATCSLAPDALSCTLHGIVLMVAIFRRSAIEQIGRFNEDLAQSEDLDFLLRFFESPLKYRVVENVSVLYRRHEGGITQKREEARSNFMRVMLLAARRRRAGGAARDMPKFFDFEELLRQHNAPLR